MHSNSSTALVLGNFFGTVSPPSKNNLSKGPHSKPSSSKSSSSEKDPYHQENKAVWKAVKTKNGSPEVIIFAVVASDHKSKMKDFVKEKGRKKAIRATVIVTTQNHLQEKINSNLNNKYAILYLLVSSNVERITYEIPGVVKEVHVALCTPPGRPDKLRIDSSSTYCGIKTYAWNQRADPTLRASGHQILHAEGCYFNFSDDMDEAVQLFQPIVGSDMSAERFSEQFGELKEEMVNFEAEVMSGSPRQVSVDSDYSPPPSADGTESWFPKSKAIISSIVGILCGAGAGGIAGAFWINSAGIVVSGPWGLSLSAGYFTAGAAGAACATVVGTTIFAGAAVYLIPWDVLWKYVKETFWSIWKSVGDALNWIWEKMKSLVTTIISTVSSTISSFIAPSPVQFVN